MGGKPSVHGRPSEVSVESEEPYNRITSLDLIYADRFYDRKSRLSRISRISNVTGLLSGKAVKSYSDTDASSGGRNGNRTPLPSKKKLNTVLRKRDLAPSSGILATTQASKSPSKFPIVKSRPLTPRTPTPRSRPQSRQFVEVPKIVGVGVVVEKSAQVSRRSPPLEQPVKPALQAPSATSMTSGKSKNTTSKATSTSLLQPVQPTAPPKGSSNTASSGMGLPTRKPSKIPVRKTLEKSKSSKKKGCMSCIGFSSSSGSVEEISHQPSHQPSHHQGHPIRPQSQPSHPQSHPQSQPSNPQSQQSHPQNQPRHLKNQPSHPQSYPSPQRHESKIHFEDHHRSNNAPSHHSSTYPSHHQSQTHSQKSKSKDCLAPFIIPSNHSSHHQHHSSHQCKIDTKESKSKNKLIVRGLRKFVDTHHVPPSTSHCPSLWKREFPWKGKYHPDNYIYEWGEGPKAPVRPLTAMAKCRKHGGRCDTCGVFSRDLCQDCRKCEMDCFCQSGGGGGDMVTPCPFPMETYKDVFAGDGWKKTCKVLCDLTSKERMNPIGSNAQNQSVNRCDPCSPSTLPSTRIARGRTPLNNKMYESQIDVLNPYNIPSPCEDYSLNQSYQHTPQYSMPMMASMMPPMYSMPMMPMMAALPPPTYFPPPPQCSYDPYAFNPMKNY